MNGSIPKERLDEWLRQRDLEVPSELAELWQETGGGNLFESETILGPFGDVLTLTLHKFSLFSDFRRLSVLASNATARRGRLGLRRD